jgi:hypothetical protein
VFSKEDDNANDANDDQEEKRGSEEGLNSFNKLVSALFRLIINWFDPL